MIAAIYKTPTLCQTHHVSSLSSLLMKMLASHYCYHHFADEKKTEAHSGSMIVQGQKNLTEGADLELWSRPDTETHIILIFCVSWTMKDLILDSPVSLGPWGLLSIALFILLFGAFWSPFTLTPWEPLIRQPIAFSSNHVANLQDSKNRTVPRTSLLARTSYHFLLGADIHAQNRSSTGRQTCLGTLALPQPGQIHGPGRSPSIPWRTGFGEKDE